jgi:small subunit ribosomal protein S15
MAKKYSGKKGKSGSSKVLGKKQPIWVRYKPKEVELLITKLSKEGSSSSEVGIILRDKYGVPSVKELTGKRITKIMEEKNILPKIPEDMVNLIKRAIALREHLEQNKKDMGAKRGLEITESKIRRLMKYYKNNNKLAQDWKYNPKDAKLYIE